MPARKSTPADDMNTTKGFEFDGEYYYVRNKFKIAKFLRLLNSEPIAAVELVLEENSYQKFEDLEMDMSDFQRFLELMSETMAGTSQGN